MRENYLKPVREQEPVLHIAVSTRALFDLEKENEIFEALGAEEYIKYQMAHEDEVLKPGPAFDLIKAFLRLDGKVEILLMSKNSAEVSLRIFHSIEEYGLDITRASFTTGRSIVPYLEAFHTDLYLSADAADVEAAIASGIPAGWIMQGTGTSQGEIPEIRIAFDGDSCIFSNEADLVFENAGLQAFSDSEREKARQPLAEGPMANFLKVIASLQQEYPADQVPIRTALVTARSAPAHERVIRTLRSWGVRIDEDFFLGGEDKCGVLEAFGAHIFFDDNPTYIENASQVVLSARVLYPGTWKLAI